MKIRIKSEHLGVLCRAVNVYCQIFEKSFIDLEKAICFAGWNIKKKEIFAQTEESLRKLILLQCVNCAIDADMVTIYALDISLGTIKSRIYSLSQPFAVASMIWQIVENGKIIEIDLDKTSGGVLGRLISVYHAVTHNNLSEINRLYVWKTTRDEDSAKKKLGEMADCFVKGERNDKIELHLKRINDIYDTLSFVVPHEMNVEEKLPIISVLDDYGIL